MIRPLRHPEDFLALAAANAPTAAAARACREGNFTPIRRFVLPNGIMGWRFTVISNRTNRWHFSITVDESERKYLVAGRKIK